jgi:hypothetical protein
MRNGGDGDCSLRGYIFYADGHWARLSEV